MKFSTLGIKLEISLIYSLEYGYYFNSNRKQTTFNVNSMKENSALVFLPSSPVFNLKEENCFQEMNLEYTSILFSALYMNYIEIISGENSFTKIYHVFDNNDESNIPDSFLNKLGKNEPYFLNISNEEESLIPFLEKVSDKFSNIYILKTNSIGFSYQEIKGYSNFLNIENDILILCKSVSERINLYAFNNFSPAIITDFQSPDLDADTYLKNICTLDKYLFLMRGFYSVENLNDFKTLYKVLSLKENYSFCSMEIHNLLTNVFIEYKDLLK